MYSTKVKAGIDVTAPFNATSLIPTSCAKYKEDAFHSIQKQHDTFEWAYSK